MNRDISYGEQEMSSSAACSGLLCCSGSQHRIIAASASKPALLMAPQHNITFRQRPRVPVAGGAGRGAAGSDAIDFKMGTLSCSRTSYQRSETKLRLWRAGSGYTRTKPGLFSPTSSVGAKITQKGGKREMGEEGPWSHGRSSKQYRQFLSVR